MALLGVTAPAGWPIISSREQDTMIVAVVSCSNELQLDGATKRRRSADATTDQKIGSALGTQCVREDDLDRSTRSMGADTNSHMAEADRSQIVCYT